MSRERVVADVGGRLRASGRVVLVGPPGIGKTTTLEVVLDRARRAGSTVLAAAPSEAESELPYAALTDLLRPLDRHVDRLPPPQRSAVTSLLDAAAPETLDERAVAAGTLSLLARAARRPLLVAVDDAMWLDDASSRALAFAVRRLAAPVVACVRSGESIPLGLGRDAHVVDVGPLGAASLRAMLDQRAGGRLPRAMLDRITEESGGNPLLAWELGRAALRRPELPGPGEDLPLTDVTMAGLAGATLAHLPDATIHALRLAALLTVPRTSDLTAAGARLSDLDAAVAAGLVTLAPTRVTFTHPVYATAVRAALELAQRRTLHADLAAATDDPDERARQLVRAHVDPDDEVAREVADAASRQADRGARRAAAELYVRAAALTTPGSPERAARILAAVRCRFDAGDLSTAADAARDVLAGGTGDVAAEALLLLADLRWYDETLDPRSSYDLAAEALAHATPGSILCGLIHSHLAIFAALPLASAEHSRHAATIFEGVPEHRRSWASALLGRFLGEARGGLPPDHGLVERALEVEGDSPLWTAGTVPAIWWATVDRTDDALDRLHRMLRHAEAGGDESWAYEILAHVVAVEILAGRLDTAAAHLAQLATIGEPDPRQHAVLAGELALRRGDLAAAVAAVAPGPHTATSDPWFAWHFRLLRARLDLAEGRPAAAAATFRAVTEELDRADVVEWQWQRYEPDWVEAALLAGDRAGADLALGRLAVRHARLPRPWTTLAVARCTVLTAAAEVAPGALDELERALAVVPVGAMLVDRGRAGLAGARAALALGEHDRARALLEVARAAFRSAGAAAPLAETHELAALVRVHAPDADDVRRALRWFHRADRLAGGPLAAADGTAEGVRDRLRRAVEEEFGTAPDERLLAGVLHGAYLAEDGGHAAAMRSLHLSRTTYYRRLAEATDRLAARVLADLAGESSGAQPSQVPSPSVVE